MVNYYERSVVFAMVFTNLLQKDSSHLDINLNVGFNKCEAVDIKMNDKPGE